MFRILRLEVPAPERIVDHLLKMARDLNPGNHEAACCSHEGCGSYNQSEKSVAIPREDCFGGKPFALKA